MWILQTTTTINNKENSDLMFFEEPNNKRKEILDVLNISEPIISTIQQITTRWDNLKLWEKFSKSDIDFAWSMDHINIHINWQVAWSQFNWKVFKDSKELRNFVSNLLPDSIQYDQFDRAEITFDIESDVPIGWTGIKSIDNIQKSYPKAIIQKEIRIPWWQESVLNGIKWVRYPEMIRNPETWKFEVALDQKWNIKNLYWKFEPQANIVRIDSDDFYKLAATNKLTIIIEKNKSTQKPQILTVFPGENAPAFPAKIDTENYKSDTLQGKESDFWEKYVLIKTNSI